MSKTRSTVVLAATTALGLSAASLMFALPGEAAPSPTSFSAETKGDVWRLNRLDADMSGDPLDVKVDVAPVLGRTGQAASPERSTAQARNVAATPTPTGQALASSAATGDLDTVGTTTAAGRAGTIAGVLDYRPSVLTARGRWAGDTTCLAATDPLTQSKSVSQGSGTVPGPIPAGTPPLVPIPLPTEIPTEIPTAPPSDFPTGLPTDLPLPTLPTGVPTTTLPPLPTITLPTVLRTREIPAAESDGIAAGEVSMVEVAPASVEQKTLLEAIPGSADRRRVATEVVGKLLTPSAPAVRFFGGEATLKLTGDPRLAAYSDGAANGSQITWTPPTMVLTVDGTDYTVPTDGTALALPYSENEDVVLTVSAGRLMSAESPQGTLAQATVSALNIIIKNGATVALDADLFPLSVKAIAPPGGVDCAPVAVEPIGPRLKLLGKDNGAKADKLVLRALPDASGAKAKVFKVVKKKEKRVGVARLDARGDHVFTIRDTNGKRATRYVVQVGRTELTTPARDRIRIR